MHHNMRWRSSAVQMLCAIVGICSAMPLVQAQEQISGHLGRHLTASPKPGEFGGKCVPDVSNTACGGGGNADDPKSPPPRPTSIAFIGYCNSQWLQCDSTVVSPTKPGVCRATSDQGKNGGKCGLSPLTGKTVSCESGLVCGKFDDEVKANLPLSKRSGNCTPDVPVERGDGCAGKYGQSCKPGLTCRFPSGKETPEGGICIDRTCDQKCRNSPGSSVCGVDPKFTAFCHCYPTLCYAKCLGATKIKKTC